MVSFIVIGKNEGERLRMCFKSILRTVNLDNIQDWEVIYVDSKSTDNSIKIAESFECVKIFCITGACNAAIARNIGATEAKGDILFFIDGDMEIQSGFLPIVVSEDGKLAYPFVSGIFVDYVYNREGEFLYSKERMCNRTRVFESVVGGLFVIDHDLWDRLDGMDNRQRKSQDYDLGLRLSEAGLPLCRYPYVLAHHHMARYSSRPDYISIVKYTALLLRKHWRNKHYLPVFIGQQYTALSLVAAIALSGMIGPWSLMVYAAALGYKLSSARKKKNSGNIVLTGGKIISRDLLLWWNLLFFHPKSPSCEYTKHLY